MNEIPGSHGQYPSISVVIATYNGAKFLAKQVHSILAQTVFPAEIIVCDDCSTDNTVAILETFKHVPGFKYYQNEQTLGVIENFKKAVSRTAPGNYIALCDQDDIWLPEKLEKSALALLQIDDGLTPAMIYSDLVLIDEHESILNNSVSNEMGQDKYRQCLQTLLFGNFVTGCTVMMNAKMKSYFLQIPDSNKYQHDAWIALIGFTFGKVARLEKGYIQYRKHNHNVTFSAHQKKSRTTRLWLHLTSVFTQNNFLQEPIALVKAFYQAYEEILPDLCKKMMLELIALENASYLNKKIAFERAFKEHWNKRF